VTALVLSVVEIVPDVPGPGTHDVTIGTWIVPPGATSSGSFVLPSNVALHSGGNYKWQMGYFHSTDGSLRDHGGEAQVAEMPFSEP
jgi:hypothetical protein